jgi:hypothetical protein
MTIEINAHLPLAGPRRGDELPDGATFERARIAIGIGYCEIGRPIDARLRHAISQASLAEEDPLGGRFADEGLKKAAPIGTTITTNIGGKSS